MIRSSPALNHPSVNNSFNPKKCAMKTKLKVLLLVCMTSSFLALTSQLLGQDSEKQKIIDVINTELQSFYQKDHAKWASTWVQSPKVVFSHVNSFRYYEVVGWDSLNAARTQYFSTPVNPEMLKITKEVADVAIKGPIAIVEVIQKWPDGLSQNQSLLLERQGKSWKILQMKTVAKESFKATDANIEAGINTQGYLLLDQKKIDEAILLFTLNTQLYPKAWNTWDSLAEAYMIKGEKDIAIGFYKKSMELNPKNTNGKQMLEKLVQK